VNKPLLNSYMALHEDNQSTLSEGIGISRSRLNAKINGTDGAEFTYSEMSAIIERYGLSPEQATALFFYK